MGKEYSYCRNPYAKFVGVERITRVCNCGNEPNMEIEGIDNWVECSNCGMSTTNRGTMIRAVRDWNNGKVNREMVWQ